MTGPSSPLQGVSLSDIEAAREAIADRVRLTPVWPSLTLEGIAGAPILQKCEQMQRTGSFKIRGALNVVRGLSATGRKRGLVTASAGNHAQGVALAAREAGIEATVVMPVLAPLSKVTATQSHGARVVCFGASLEEAREHAQVLAESEGRTYVPPFDDDAIIAGQGTLGLELLEQVPDLEEVIVPAGGGGLLAGVATAVKARRPEVRVIGVQAAAMDGVCQSFAAGEVRAVPPARTLADGAAVAGPSERTFALIQAHVDEMVSCGDTAIAQAIVLLLERSKMVVEGAGALGVAALISGVYRPKGKAAVILSGGNIDVNLVGSIVRHGLVEAGRYRHLTVEVVDTPGELALVSGAIAGEAANLLRVRHDREAPGLPVGVAIIDLLVEVNDQAHFDRVTNSLRDEGLVDLGVIPSRLATPGARRRYESL